MKTLDEQIADIEKLDDLRRQARKLRQEAIDGLSAESYVPRPRPAPERDDWEKPGDEVEKAQVLRALRIGKAKDRNLVRQTANRQTLVDDLLSIQYKHLTSGHGRDNVPVLRAAHVLQALAEIPGLVFSPTARPRFFPDSNGLLLPNCAGTERRRRSRMDSGSCTRRQEIDCHGLCHGRMCACTTGVGRRP